jgi:hypothetical protein
MASSENALFYGHSELYRRSYSRLGSDWYVEAHANCAVIHVECSFTGSNGANLAFPDSFGIPDTDNTACVTLGTCVPCSQLGTCERNSWIIGLVNSMPYITIALL